jgi:hypothetical protein
MLQNTFLKKHCSEQVVRVSGKHNEGIVKVTRGSTNIRKLYIIPRSSCKVSTTNDSTNDLDPTYAPKIWKPKSKVRKLKGSDIK